jgi:RNA polymerase sigma-70 factor (ECF subfamily)
MHEEREERWRAWMVAAQQGDSAAYEKLLLELVPYIRGRVRPRMFDPNAVEDVVQNVFVSLHRARHTFRPERAFLPWIHAVSRNAVVDYIRDRQRRAPREISLDADGVPEPAVAAAAPRADALSPELSAALAKLPDAQRQAVLLIQLEGLSVDEASARVGVSKSALKVRAHRGYHALRALLEEEPS